MRQRRICAPLSRARLSTRSQRRSSNQAPGEPPGVENASGFVCWAPWISPALNRLSRMRAEGLPWRRITFATVTTSKRSRLARAIRSSKSWPRCIACRPRRCRSRMPIPSGRKTRARIEPSRAFASQGRTPSARPAGQFVDDLSFCVSHSLVAHRPLGSIMRARLRAYPEMSRLRRSTNGVVLAEPVSVAEVPA